MTTKNTPKHDPQQLLKQQFLDALQNADSLSEALDACAMPKSTLCALLIKNKAFQNAFDKIINLKLEMALLEAALKSKSPGVLSFSLSNRLPKKYNKTKKEAAPERAKDDGPGQIVYVESE